MMIEWVLFAILAVITSGHGAPTSYPTFLLKPASTLFVSRPDPRRFGNEANPRRKNSNWSANNWLTSRFHFSFAEYRPRPEEQRDSFGVVRVMNDDLVQPARGFGMHGHRNMEICTYIVDGFLTHQDSLGSRETLGRGSIQFMSAGSGVRHSEHNLDRETPLRFVQIWINTRAHNTKPLYGGFDMGADNTIAAAARRKRKNGWLHAVGDQQGQWRDSADEHKSDECEYECEYEYEYEYEYEEEHEQECKNNADKCVQGADEGQWTTSSPTETREAAKLPQAPPILINQDANVYVSELDPSTRLDFRLATGRQAYLLCIEGGVTLKGHQVQRRSRFLAANGGDQQQGSERPQTTHTTMKAGDAAEVYGPGLLRVTSDDEHGAHLLMLEVAF